MWCLNEAAFGAALLVDPSEPLDFQFVHAQARRAEEEGHLNDHHPVYRAEDIVQGVVLSEKGERNSASRLHKVNGRLERAFCFRLIGLTEYAVMGTTQGVASVAFCAGHSALISLKKDLGFRAHPSTCH